MPPEITSALEPGLIYGIASLGLALSYRYLRFPDFTVLGSILCGGIVAVYVGSHLGPWTGIAAAFLVGILLGTCSGVLVALLGIQAVLAGIISFTASFTLAYLLAPGGSISFESGTSLPLSPEFTWRDFLWLAATAVAFCVLAALVLKSRVGALLVAMRAKPDFLSFRHRYRSPIFVSTVALGNGLVALGGGLHAWNDFGAYVDSHRDFLPFALGGIFAGNAVTAWAARAVNHYRIDDDGTRGETKSAPVARFFAAVFMVERDDSSRVVVLFLSYIAATFFFTVLSGAVNANILGNQFHIALPSYTNFALVALLMVFFVWWSGADDPRSRD